MKRIFIIIIGLMLLLLLLAFVEKKRFSEHQVELTEISYSILSKLQTFFSHNYYYPDSLQELIEFGYTMEEYPAEMLERLSKYSIRIVKSDSGIFVLQTNPNKEFKFEYTEQLTYFDFLLGKRNVFLCYTDYESVSRSVMGKSDVLGEFFVGKKVIRDYETRQQLNSFFTNRLDSVFILHEKRPSYIVVLKYSRESGIDVGWSNPPMDSFVVDYKPLFSELTDYSDSLFGAYNVDSAFIKARLPFLKRLHNKKRVGM